MPQSQLQFNVTAIYTSFNWIFSHTKYLLFTCINLLPWIYITSIPERNKTCMSNKQEIDYNMWPLFMATAIFNLTVYVDNCNPMDCGPPVHGTQAEIRAGCHSLLQIFRPEIEPGLQADALPPGNKKIRYYLWSRLADGYSWRAFTFVNKQRAACGLETMDFFLVITNLLSPLKTTQINQEDFVLACYFPKSCIVYVWKWAKFSVLNEP